MRALVTGANGFVGRHMAAELEARGYEVIGSDVVGARPYAGLDCRVVFGLHQTTYDLVVHAAARSPHRQAIDTAPQMHLYNRMLDAQLFEWAARTQQRHVLYFSSCAVLDAEPDAYGLTKLAGEELAAQARTCGVPVTVVQPFSGYGEDQADDFPFGAFADRARRRADPFEIWGDGRQVRDWIHIDDVVRGALALVDADVDGPASLCTGIGTSMFGVARMFADAVGYEPTFAHRGDRPAGQPRRVGDPTQLHEFYKPQISIEEGVARAVAA